ncbi:glycerophosphodiester phosphodiesterase family protein [Stackebrandtia nassauensis]|uniref:glycerophosphodiester phosphodiesterase n=1 Tax=Stackebrandtia nassauensis (strain DSM 44728 / CIP 108903 / NRRL B-16338 / NBRC 102104 / LLR-40K-21) TaxID=446470 RepID=D3Q8W1_STANL|nr:glycerophosphodiester phosphodiesterase family protein [Stackebrandtia nassauensis]ADD40570.1 glycerophosphoryl diester phosphodiesterase [Stackebrandtia nassauensis DSM 44728]
MRRKLVATAAAVGVLAGCLALAPSANAEPAKDKKSAACDVMVTGHRGASGYRPEHTIEAYTVAVTLGADYFEPDLVPTKDGQLVARHESEISQTTNVADKPEFASRKTTKVIDGVSYTGWFTEDFTLKELKTLRAKERLPELRPYNKDHDGLYPIMTIEEIIKLRKDLSFQNKREVGIYPELKHPTYFNSIGLKVEELLDQKLGAADLDDADDPVLIQSFEEGALKKMDSLVDNKLVFVIGDKAATPDKLKEYAKWLHAVSYAKDIIIPRKSDGSLGTPSTAVKDAHTAGLDVHSWTFRNENFFLPTNLRIGDYPPDWGNYQEEYRLFINTGIDQMFSDFPDKAIDAREECSKKKN